MKKVLMIGSIILAGLSLLFFNFHEENYEPTEKDSFKRLEYVLTHVVKDVHPIFKPVFIRKDGIILAFGTQLQSMNKNTQPALVTSAHIFSNKLDNSPHEFKCAIIEKRNDKKNHYEDIGYVSAVTFDPTETIGDIADIAICTLGKPMMIYNTSRYKVESFLTDTLIIEKVKKFFVKSIITGEKSEIIGFVSTKGGTRFFVMLYDATPGESGTGFVSDDNRLFCLSSWFIHPGISEQLDIPKKFTRFTLLSELVM